MTPFTPRPLGTVSINVSSSASAAQELTKTPGIKQIRVMNNGTATAWIEFGGDAVSASTSTGIPIGAGVTEVFTLKKADAPLYVSAIAAGSTGRIYFTPGTGI